MTEKYRTKAIVFKKDNASEADKIFSIFSQDFGKIELRGKAIRKINSKLRSGLDLFYLSEVEFIEGKNNKTLTDALALEKFKKISFDLEKTKMALMVSNVLNNFLKGHGKDIITFKLLQETFERINENNGEKSYIAYCYFVWNFLANQGYKPEVLKCVICSGKLNPSNLYFSYKEGGTVCENCSQSHRSAQKINSDIVKVIRIVLSRDWQTASKLKIEQTLKQVLEQVCERALLNFCPA